jgi:hypothetical protein
MSVLHGFFDDKAIDLFHWFFDFSDFWLSVCKNSENPIRAERDLQYAVLDSLSLYRNDPEKSWKWRILDFVARKFVLKTAMISFVTKHMIRILNLEELYDEWKKESNAKSVVLEAHVNYMLSAASED